MTGAEPLGGAGEEAARLLEAVRRWVDDRFVDAESNNIDTEPIGQEGGHHQPGPDCRYCPLCQAAAALRNNQPEVYEHLNRAVDSLFAAVRAGASSPASRSAESRSEQRHAQPRHTQDPPDVEHIVIS